MSAFIPNYVEISPKRFAELIRKEHQVDLIRKMHKELPTYQFPEFLRAMFADESEVKADAE